MYAVQDRLTSALGIDGAVPENVEPGIPGTVAPVFGPGQDRIRSTVPAVFQTTEGYVPGTSSGDAGSAQTGILASLCATIGQLLQMLGLGGASSYQGMQNVFANATASSTGDPHLSFHGTTSSGQTDQARFDSMASHQDLLDSNSIAGGFRISTTATPAGANGVTYNQQAAITTNCGRTQVCMQAGGAASIDRNGVQSAIAPGQSYDLGDGEWVARNADGSVVVTDYSGTGGSISTSLTANGSGVDVRVQAQDVALGGDLLGETAPTYR